MKKKYKKRYYPVLLVFFMYWMVTIFFNTPENYLKIKLLKVHRVFELFFYQNWGFFAPPPNTNERLYCVVYAKSDTISKRVFELVSPIIKEKIKNAPFNSKADLLDYVISSSIVGITNKIVSFNETFDYMLSEKKIVEKNREFFLIQELQETNHFKTLLKYAKEILRNKGVDLNESLISLELVQLPIKKFVDRNKEKKIKKYVVFKSDLFDLSEINYLKQGVGAL